MTAFGDPAALGLLGLAREPRERLVERLLPAVERDAEVGEELVEERPQALTPVTLFSV